MSFSWSREERLKNEGFQKAQDQMTDREQAVITRERELAKRAAELEAKGDRINILNENHDDIVVLTNQAKFDLEKASFESEKADFEITKKNLANDASLLQKKLDEKDRECQVRLDNQASSLAVEYAKSTNELYDRAIRGEAKADAKDAIIASKDQEITRLDELLKVTMGKLTQIDVKGLTIHVENDHKFSAKDKE